MRVKIFLFVCALSCCLFSKGQQVIDVPYDFPIKPGTEKWKEFKTGQEMVDACQIPAEILQRMSTEALAETCLNYPLALDYSAYNDERVGIKYVIDDFNGLQELAKRPDGALFLIKLYKGMPVNTKRVRISTQIKDNASILYISYLELLLANDNFKNQLSTTECIELQKVVQTKYEEKLRYPNTYDIYCIKRSLLLGSLLVDIAKGNSLSATQKAKISEFVKNFENPNTSLIHEISTYIYK